MIRFVASIEMRFSCHIDLTIAMGFGILRRIPFVHLMMAAWWLWPSHKRIVLVLILILGRESVF